MDSLAYASRSVPCPADTRVSLDDFKVNEVTNLDGLTSLWGPDLYPAYEVEKRSIDTLHLESELASQLGSRLTFGGLKDKRAIAKQYFTMKRRGAKGPVEVRGSGYTARLVGYLPRPIGRVDIRGNQFKIILRNVCSRAGEVLDEVFELGERNELPNYFGPQR